MTMYPNTYEFIKKNGQGVDNCNLEMTHGIDSDPGLFDDKNGKVKIVIKFTKEFSAASVLLSSPLYSSKDYEVDYKLNVVGQKKILLSIPVA